MPKRHLLAISIVYFSICLYYYYSMAAMTDPGFPLDDSWIHQVFARNIATGNSFSFEPGVPFAGSTAPLWTLLLAPMWFLFGPVAGGIALGVLFQWLAILGMYKLANLLTNSIGISLLTAVFSVLCWPVIWGALSGMEIGLYSALSIWGIYYYFKSGEQHDFLCYISYVLITLAVLARPECAIILAGFIIRDAYAWGKSSNKQILPWVYKAIIVLIITFPYFAFNYKTTGGLLPQTFHVKVRGKDLISALLNGDMKRAFKALAVYPLLNIQDFYKNIIKINPLIFFFIAAGIVKLAKANMMDRSKNIMFIMLGIFYIPLIAVFSPKYMPTFQNYRYVTHILVITVLFGALGLFWKTDFDYGKIKKYLSRTGFVIAISGLLFGIAFSVFDRQIAALFVQNPAMLTPADYAVLKKNVMDISMGIIITGTIILAGRFPLKSGPRRFLYSITSAVFILAVSISLFTSIRKADLYANNVRNVNECDVAAGEYLMLNAKPESVVAVNDIGAIGYFSEMEIFDLKGLVSPQISLEMLKNDSLLFEYMDRYKRVDYMAIAPGWYDYLLRRPDIFHKIAVFSSDDCTDVVSDTTLLFKATWPEQ